MVWSARRKRKNPEQRDKLHDWLTKTVMPLGEAGGKTDIIYIGTILHYDSVLSRTLNNPMWKTARFKAVIQWPANMKLWDEWEELIRNKQPEAAEALYRQNEADMLAGSVVSWAARPLLALMKIRVRDGHDTFDSEYQNDPVSGEDALFAGCIKFWVNRLDEWVFYGAVDPSLGKKNKNRDPSAILVGGFNRFTGILDVVEADIPDMEDIILNGMSSVGYGFSCQEISWAFVDKTWLPDAVTLRPHNWFITLPEHNDELRLDDGNCGEDGKDGSALWPFGWLVHRYNARSGFLGSSGLFRVLVWPYLFKNFALRDMAEFLEIYGLPARIAYYAQGTSDADRDNILEALVNLGHEAVAALPQGNEIEFKEAASGGPEAFMSMVEWAERTTSKVILGSTLTSQADGKSSTNALGNVHNEVRHDILTADARQLSGMFSSLIQMMASLNGWQDIPPRRLPRLVFDVQQEADIKSVAEAVSVLVNNVGMKDIPVSWVRQKTGIPTPKDGEEVLVPVAQRLPVQAGLSQLRERLNIAVLSQQDNGEDDPAQRAIDRAELPAEAIAQGMNELVAPLVQAIQEGRDADEAMNVLAEAWPELPDDTLRQLLTQAFFVADIWGRLNADS